ncbi:MAG: apolipoprotein N-acyltransferase [Chthoniobacterales bacterium]
MKHLWPWLLAATSGALLALCLPPYEVDTLAWFALIPLLAALWFGPRGGRWHPVKLFGLGYVAGLVFFWMTLFWMTEVTRAGWFVFAFYLALYPGLWALFAGIVCRPRDPVDRTPAAIQACDWLSSIRNLRLAIRAAAAWAGLEWLRGTAFTGFGWNSYAVALWKSTVMLQIADFAGIAGISFLLVMVNAILLMTVRRFLYEASGGIKLRPHFDFTITMALVVCTFGYGVWRMTAPKPVSQVVGKNRQVTTQRGDWLLSIAAVQANIPQDHKWDPAWEKEILDTYMRLTDQALLLKPDLLIWPEAAVPRPLLDSKDLQDIVAKILGQLRTNFLLGSTRFEPPFAYNSAMLFNAHGDAQIYDKQHLVPFGEYVPLRNSFPLFAWIVGDEVPSDFDAGTESAVLTLSRKPYHVGTLICFEDTLGDLARQFAKHGAELLVTITNDGWFRKSAGSRQHLANAVFRCAETHLPLVRAANTGITCFVDRFGAVTNKLQSRGDTFVEGVLYGTVPIRLEPPKTFYTLHGDLFALLCLFGALLSIRTHLLTARRRGLSES